MGADEQDERIKARLAEVENSFTASGLKLQRQRLTSFALKSAPTPI